MKKTVSLILVLVMMFALAAAAAVPASAASVLTVKAGTSSVTLNVGEEVLFTVCLYAGSTKVVNGQGYVTYNSEKLEIDTYGDYVGSDQHWELYCFPLVKNSSLVCNTEHNDYIYYNFSKAKGITAFDSDDKVLFKMRFKAIGTGTVTLSNVIEFMVNEDEEKVYYETEPDADIAPYMTYVLEKGSYLVGDVNNDYAVDIKDATYLQRICAGSSDSYTLVKADANLDGSITLYDAVAVQSFIAGKPVNKEVGEWVFSSEQ